MIPLSGLRRVLGRFRGDPSRFHAGEPLKLDGERVRRGAVVIEGTVERRGRLVPVVHELQRLPRDASRPLLLAELLANDEGPLPAKGHMQGHLSCAMVAGPALGQGRRHPFAEDTELYILKTIQQESKKMSVLILGYCSPRRLV